MAKIKIGVIFGGMSTENEVSVVSGKYILKNLDKEKYKIFPIYISKEGKWYEYTQSYDKLEMGKIPEKINPIENFTKYIKQLDVIFPVLHGLYGEDGTIQGLLELLQVPYVGCKVLASSIGMDKVYAKIVLDKAGILQTKSCYIKKAKDTYIYVDEKFNEEKLGISKLCKKIESKLKYPMFIKPSNSGSSVGVSKAQNINQLQIAIEEAGTYDNKILVEEGIKGKEVECAVLGNENVIAGKVGEIKSAEEFYSYNAKYSNEESKTEIPADLPKELEVDASGLETIEDKLTIADIKLPEGVEFADKELDELSWDMVYKATTKEEFKDLWVDYIVRWNEVLPEITLYSDLYHDLYNAKIGGYEVNPDWGVASAILYCYDKTAQ